MHKQTILVTGGAGFIGSAFVRLIIRDCSRNPEGDTLRSRVSPNKKKGTVPKIVILDSLTYAGDLKRLEEVEGKFKFYKVNICDKNKVEAIFKKEKPALVFHFAAESHVDRSINDALPFIETNIKGTQILMDASRMYPVDKFIFVSTDEVYGDIAKGKYKESSSIKPSSPYAASKAAADLLVQSYMRTYKFPAIIIRPSNNYGPWQYPEKLIPLAILRILEGGKVPVYGKGKNVREWLYVDDCARGILVVANKGRIGEIYNLGSNQESQNINTVKLLLKTIGVSKNRLEFVKDRLGHDFRYSLNFDKLTKEIGWRPSIKLNVGLKLTIAWALEHESWLKSKLRDINKLYRDCPRRSLSGVT